MRESVGYDLGVRSDLITLFPQILTFLYFTKMKNNSI